MVTGYEAEFYENIKQIRKDMGHICQCLNEKLIIDGSISSSLKRISEAMEDGKQ